MSIKRITISVQEDVAARIKKAAGSTPVSTWVTELIEGHLDDQVLEQQWRAFYRDVRPTPKDIRAAGAKLRRLTRPRPRRGSA